MRRLPMKLSALTTLALTTTVTLTLTLTTTSAQATSTAPATTTPATAPTTAPRVSTAFTIPGEKVYPEGIAADPRTGTVYVGSYADGTIYRARPGARTAEVFLPAGTDGRDTANGLRVDALGRLWVTDSTTGVAVYDPRTGTRLAHFEVGGGDPFFVNDLTITPDGTAYLTDSIRAVVYRVTPAQLAAGSGPLLPAFDLRGHLTPQPAGTFTLNGITTDRAGRYLLTVDMTAGDLHRIDLRTGAISRVALTGADLKHADGLDLSADGSLRAAHNTTNTLTRWRLSPDGTRARLTRTITDPGLQIPTTLAHTPGRTLVVRSQFDKGGPMTPSTGTPTTFTIASVRGL
ncbi:SMP-30/gluconolactonase/LRE family protein [Streptomyces sp. APSN-46.1]|uniref:SMP-30/gluconolactonase/LRE family protein n=1 Tax=Streptomyces sp. APSN-46.1 TaxID=2929049 RepID=UPI001FB1A5D4|nr:SMP-30/gluconolactonase/LRE family protein [Streptomyces sp. APSN-46.1]MCJ1677935.1 SMP-30/gluconolactonase/LRE family protein [Streptomyces sp. APSN-46.1]